jgi:hypothetical protein
MKDAVRDEIGTDQLIADTALHSPIWLFIVHTSRVILMMCCKRLQLQALAPIFAGLLYHFFVSLPRVVLRVCAACRCLILPAPTLEQLHIQ